MKCLSYFFCCCEKKHHDQSNLGKKDFNWGYVYGFRGLVYDHHGGLHGHRQAGMVLVQNLRAHN